MPAFWATPLLAALALDRGISSSVRSSAIESRREPAPAVFVSVVAVSMAADWALEQVHWPRSQEQGSRRDAHSVRSASCALIGSFRESLYPRVILMLRFGRLFGRRLGISGAPAHFLLAGTETSEIAAARGTAVRSRAAAKHDHGPARRVIVLLTPSGQILAVTSGTACEFPRSGGPDAGRPAASAAAATERVDSKKGPDFLGKVLFMRNPNVACSALWTSKLHETLRTTFLEV